MKKQITPKFKGSGATHTMGTPTPSTPSKPKTAEEIKAERIQALIDGAQGAQDYIKTAFFCKWIFHTDSVDHVCKEAGAFWFLDVIVSHIPKILKKYGKGADYQVWRMTVKKNREARIWCEDGNGNKLAAQIIPYTDFPLASFEVFCERGSLDGKTSAFIIMLPGDR